MSLPLPSIFPTYAEFNLVATTILTVYNGAAKNPGLGSRMCKFVPERRGEAPPEKMRIYHSKGDKDDWRSGLAAVPSTASASASSKRPQPHQEEDQEGKRHRESAQQFCASSRQLGLGLELAILELAKLRTRHAVLAETEPVVERC